MALILKRRIGQGVRIWAPDGTYVGRVFIAGIANGRTAVLGFDRDTKVFVSRDEDELVLDHSIRDGVAVG